MFRHVVQEGLVCFDCDQQRTDRLLSRFWFCLPFEVSVIVLFRSAVLTVLLKGQVVEVLPSIWEVVALMPKIVKRMQWLCSGGWVEFAGQQGITR